VAQRGSPADDLITPVGCSGISNKAHAGVLVDGPGSLWILRDSVLLKAASGDEG